MKNNSLLLKALRNEPVTRPPIWIMRQAGRYMPQYQKIRQKHSFLEMCHTPEVACEITLQPIQAFGMDAAILFSDILVTAEAMGGQLRFEEGKGPLFDNPIRSHKDLEQYQPDTAINQLDYVFQAIQLLQQALPAETPLIGFAGAPFTVASYLIEGSGSKSLALTHRLKEQNPSLFHQLLHQLEQVTVDYLNGQIKAGVDALQIFDSWANTLSWDDFKTYSLDPVSRIIHQLDNPNNIPVIFFSRGSSLFWPQMIQSPAQAIGLDWHCDLVQVREQAPKHIALQGNLDPHILYGTPQDIRTKATHLLKRMAPYKGWIFNLGHGILPDMSPNHVKHLVDTVQSFSS